MIENSFTAKEIFNQPALWKETYESVLKQKDQISSYLNNIYKIDNLQIVLAGAGSSAFIGKILGSSFEKNTGLKTSVIPTTDIVTHPKQIFRNSIPTLLISFARSGDSPESIATFDLGEKLTDNIYHLIISCNPEGELVKKASTFKNAFIFLLPLNANDQALAMTGSFTSMTLAGLLISDIHNIEKNEQNVQTLIELGREVLKKYEAKLRMVANMDFKRIVFLGSGPMRGVAEESHLKVIELTDGQIVCQYDSFLGYRHGPKALIDASTLLVYLFSNDPYVHQYEKDLVKSINNEENFFYTIGIGQCIDISEKLNLNISLGTINNPISDDFFSICSVIPAQILAYYKSLFSGLIPDFPSKRGGIHRIVQGVTIYPFSNL